MNKIWHGWIPSTIHRKLFKSVLAIAKNRLNMREINEHQAAHFFIEGFRSAREIAEANSSASDNTTNTAIALLNKMLRDAQVEGKTLVPISDIIGVLELTAQQQ